MIVVCAPFLLDVKAQNLDPMAGTKLEGLETGSGRAREYVSIIN